MCFVSTETRDIALPDAAGIVLDFDRYMQLFRLIGCDSVPKIADVSGVSWRQIYRAKAGAVVGEVFMARTIAALQQHAEKLAEYGHEPPTLDDLFTVEARKAA